MPPLAGRASPCCGCACARGSFVIPCDAVSRGGIPVAATGPLGRRRPIGSRSAGYRDRDCSHQRTQAQARYNGTMSAPGFRQVRFAMNALRRPKREGGDTSGAGVCRSHRSAERRMRSVDPALPSPWPRASPSRHPCGFQEQTATGGDAPCRCRTPFTCPSSTPGAAREKISCLAWIPVPRPEPPAGEDNWIGP